MAAGSPDIRTELQTIAQQLTHLSERPVKDLGWLLQVLQCSAYMQGLAIAAASSSLGECRKETPFAPLRPVIDSNGNFKWCCEHDPEHCSA